MFLGTVSGAADTGATITRGLWCGAIELFGLGVGTYLGARRAAATFSTAFAAGMTGYLISSLVLIGLTGPSDAGLQVTGFFLPVAAVVVAAAGGLGQE